MEEKILHKYYDNEARHLYSMVDKILKKFGGISDKDKDDFYALASTIFVDVLIRWDREQSFDGFLYSCLVKKFKTEMTARNRIKRICNRKAISLDVQLSKESDSTLADVIPDNKDVENIVFAENVELFSDKMIRYLNRLSNVQKEILKLTVAGYIPSEIISALHITEKEYIEGNAAIHSYRNVSVLF